MSIETKIEVANAVIADALAQHSPAAFASSFGAEDMVILDMLAQGGCNVDLFTLDTGRLHPETHELMNRARARYRRPIRVLSPQAEALEAYVSRHGTNAFYESTELRKQCCQIRKVEPLRRALQGKKLWMTGLRRDQALSRAAIDTLAWDESNGLWKLSPLADWTDADVWSYVAKFDVPTNTLHTVGYPSIGCAPCTRAVAAGDDPRSGRWWWEQAGARECGLHVDEHGRLVRRVGIAS